MSRSKQRREKLHEKLPLTPSRSPAQSGGEREAFEPLPREFYEPAAGEVAPRLLGHWLVRRTARGLSGGLIVETEAYLAHDPASHGYKRETARNRVMYGPPIGVSTPCAGPPGWRRRFWSGRLKPASARVGCGSSAG